MASLQPSQIVFYCYSPFFIVETIIFTRFLYKIYVANNNETTRKISSFQQILHIICFTSIILTSIFDILHAFGSMISNTTLLPQTEFTQICRNMADIFYFTSSLTLYVILIERLFSTFSNTVYEISKYLLILLITVIVIQGLVMTSYCLNVAIFNCREIFWCNMAGIQDGVITIIDYILNIILFTLFIHKLRQLVLIRLQHDCIDVNVNDALHNIMNNRLLNVITKQTLIGILITLFNQAFGTCVFLTETWDILLEEELIADYLTRGIEGIFVCLLLYLGLHINNNEYMKICGKCHKMCYKCCLNKTKNNIEHNTYYLIELNE